MNKIVVVWWNDSGIKQARLVEIFGNTTIFLGEFQQSCENMTFHSSVDSFFKFQNLYESEKKEFIETGSIVFDNWKENK